MTYCITHTDLDGIGCAVLMEKAFSEVKTYTVDYRELPNILPQLLEMTKGSQVYITDLSLTEDLAKLCDKHGKVQHIDHHISNKKVSDHYPWSLTNTEDCATFLLWKMLSNYLLLEDYRDFVDTVNSYDTWGHGSQPSELARDLNRLLKMMDPVDFVNRFKANATINFSDSEKALIKSDQFLEDKYLAEALPRTQAMKDKDGNTFLIIAAEQYTSSLGHYLLHQFEEAEYILILDMLHDRASLRSKGKVNVADIAKSCGGGGHAKAAGFLMSDAAIKSFWRCDSCEWRIPRNPDMDK